MYQDGHNLLGLIAPFLRLAAARCLKLNIIEMDDRRV